MECIPSCNPTSFAGSSSSSKANNMSKEEKGAAEVKKSKKGVMKLSTDPQSVAARERRHRISDRFKILQSMVPGGSKNTASMLEEAIHYVKFLKTQIWLHETMINFVYDESSMFLPHQDCFPYEQIFSLQQNTAVSFDDSLETLPQLPLDQWCFQGEEEDITIDANMKYWPA